MEHISAVTERIAVRLLIQQRTETGRENARKLIAKLRAKRAERRAA